MAIKGNIYMVFNDGGGDLPVHQNVSFEYAKKVLHKAVSINPQNGFYLDSLGWLYYQKNDLNQRHHF